MKQKHIHIKMITHAALLAVTLVVSIIIEIVFKPITLFRQENLLSLQLQFYVIAAMTLYIVTKFGKKYGWLTALAGTIGAFFLLFLLKIITMRFLIINAPATPSILTWFEFLYFFIPWASCTLIAFVPKDNKLFQGLYVFIVWILIMMSQALSFFMDNSGGKSYWHILKEDIITVDNLIMWIILTVFTVLWNSKFNTKIKQDNKNEV